MRGIWAKNFKTEMNTTLAFSLDLERKEAFSMKIAGASFYRIYVDGQFFGFGPQRAAKGYARAEKIALEGKRIVVEVENIGVESFWMIKQSPFFACEIETEKGGRYEAKDFICQLLTDRLRAVQRYSYQRGFIETYKMSKDRRALYAGDRYAAPVLETEETEIPTLLPSYVDRAKYALHTMKKTIEEGAVTLDRSLPVWRDRAHWLIGTELEGFKTEEWEDAATDEASVFVYHADGEKRAVGEYRYETVDFSRAITGFVELEVEVKSPGTVYVLYDELLWDECGKGENYVAFERNTTSNVFKWQFEKAGTYHVTTFEPYTLRYARIVHSDGMEVKLFIRDYENPNADRFKFSCSDKRLERIMEAARATLAQNSVDILMDCPSRERAGWLSDSWFSSVAERLFTGDNQAERAFLDNYVKAHREGLPEGMLPMCYPSDFLGGAYIPNWSLWYIMEIAKYARIYGKDDTVYAAKENIFGVLNYFKNYENEFGLLENLDGWVFVEWSEANKSDHICGVNVPSNIEYAACLEAAGELYGEERLIAQAKQIRAWIKENAFDGRFFVDNLVRDSDGKLKQSGLLTEVCQYYAFWFGCITKEEYPDLYEELMERLGTNRADGYLPEICPPNVMYGLYMRIDLLMRDGARSRVLEELLRLFEPMAKRTGTLWEHNNIRASCDHGFAAYAGRWIVYALTGYDCLTGSLEEGESLGIGCEIVLPLDAQGNTRSFFVKGK